MTPSGPTPKLDIGSSASSGTGSVDDDDPNAETFLIQTEGMPMLIAPDVFLERAAALGRVFHDPAETLIHG
jgi:hypothetical protein